MAKEIDDAAGSDIQDNSTLYVGLGLGLGGYATATTVLAGFACPVCMVAAPALIATGIYQKIRNRNRRPANECDIPAAPKTLAD
ncbi:hypothetical protein RSM50_003504 [Pseudomonas aeruginosa]|nr:hypothetical protein [Pseudomonas aeruginosa]